MTFFWEVIGGVILCLLLVAAVMVIGPVFFGAPWHPARRRDIRLALEWCEPIPGETLVDLGSGDGRVLLLAAREFGLNAVGLEIDPLKAAFSRWRVRRAGLSHRITVFCRNALEHDYRDADILFIYLSHQSLDRLWPTLRAQLKPTARIVCYRFRLRGFQPHRASPDGTLFLYRMDKGLHLDGYT